VHNAPDYAPKGDIAPFPVYPLTPDSDDRRALYLQAAEHGERLLAAGKVAAFTVAGGQGSRLGFDAPKGTYRIGPISNKPLFQIFAERILRIGERAGKAIPWYIMTSPATDAPTREYFAENANFGVADGDVFFLMQGTMPCFDKVTGKMLLADKGRLALSPDGHGGSLQAMRVSGALDDMRRRGVEYISYFQVDNPLVSVINSQFIGLHDLTGSEMSSRSLTKRDPGEKVGVFCTVDGVAQIIEYSDLPMELMEARDDSGALAYSAGSPAIHVISVGLVERLTASSNALPFHRAVKKVAHLTESGDLAKPETQNAIKLERFIFDALPRAAQPMVLEAARENEFAPVKNAEGEDSPLTCRTAMQEKFAGWLTRRGIDVPRKADGSLDCVIEISHRLCADEKDFRDTDVSDIVIIEGEESYIG
jgi:UDP-N-acetylglucosamine/UDP-N-acetylgalactosamine diphosphorylase